MQLALNNNKGLSDSNDKISLLEGLNKINI